MPLRASRATIEELILHAREALPRECCGLLVGAPDEIAWTTRARNLDPSPGRYLVDPEDHFEAQRRARSAGLSVIGAYHSHPGREAVPSAADRAEADAPEFLYVIVSPEAGVEGVRAYRLSGGNFQAVELVLV